MGLTILISWTSLYSILGVFFIFRIECPGRTSVIPGAVYDLKKARSAPMDVQRTLRAKHARHYIETHDKRVDLLKKPIKRKNNPKNEFVL